MASDKTESLRECGATFKSGKECEGQVSQWAETVSGNLSGYWCTRCGAYRGKSGDQSGRHVNV